MTDVLADIKTLHRKAEAQRADAAYATGKLHDAIAAALADGTKATDIAATLGLTRSRIYQLARKAR